MPSFAYSMARCWVIVSRPPLVIIGTAAVTPRIGFRARAAVIGTMLPPVFCANICLIESWVMYRKPSTFVDRLEASQRRLDDLGGSGWLADVTVHQRDVVGSHDLGGLGNLLGIGHDV